MYTLIFGALGLAIGYAFDNKKLAGGASGSGNTSQAKGVETPKDLTDSDNDDTVKE